MNNTATKVAALLLVVIAAMAILSTFGGTTIQNLINPQGAPPPVGRQNLQLETFHLTGVQAQPTKATIPLNEFTDDPNPPGSFPNRPPTPAPTVTLTDIDCTLTIGFWKNHAGFGPQDDVMTPLLPIWLGTAEQAKSINVANPTIAVTILQKKFDASNGINQLYAQFLAAKLNVKAGASSSNLPIAATDTFLANHTDIDWETLSAAQQLEVHQWATLYDDYNNGRVGPGHCQ
jgi:hypothetical protein